MSLFFPAWLRLAVCRSSPFAIDAYPPGNHPTLYRSVLLHYPHECLVHLVWDGVAMAVWADPMLTIVDPSHRKVVEIVVTRLRTKPVGQAVVACTATPHQQR